MNSLRLTVSVLALALAAPALASASGGTATVEATRMGSWGIDTAGMDTSVKPGDDFFAYVNGNWAKNTQIPADRSSFGAFASSATSPNAACAISSKVINRQPG